MAMGKQSRKRLAVDVPPVTDFQNQHEQHLVRDLINNSIIADSHTPEGFLTGQFHATGRTRVFCERNQDGVKSAFNILVRLRNSRAARLLNSTRYINAPSPSRVATRHRGLASIQI